jgi:mRNA interferase RelE/StbE
LSYQISITRKSQKELANLPTKDYESVKTDIKDLASSPRPQGCKKLSGREGWRIKVGDYRVIYEIDDKEKIVTVLHIGHRREIYR